MTLFSYYHACTLLPNHRELRMHCIIWKNASRRGGGVIFFGTTRYKHCTTRSFCQRNFLYNFSKKGRMFRLSHKINTQSRAENWKFLTLELIKTFDKYHEIFLCVVLDHVTIAYSICCVLQITTQHRGKIEIKKKY